MSVRLLVPAASALQHQTLDQVEWPQQRDHAYVTMTQFKCSFVSNEGSGTVFMTFKIRALFIQLQTSLAAYKLHLKGANDYSKGTAEGFFNVKKLI